MQMSQFHYLPLSPGFFTILVGLFALVILLLELGALRYAYLSLGVSPRAAFALLFGSLIGSYFNIPIANLPDERVGWSGERSASLGAAMLQAILRHVETFA